jgi:predicted HTH domain antitoxin
MSLIISDDILKATNVSEAELLLEFAIYLYDKNRLSLAKACKLAGLDQLSFQKELAIHGIYLKYSIEDLHQDLETLNISV